MLHNFFNIEECILNWLFEVQSLLNVVFIFLESMFTNVTISVEHVPINCSNCTRVVTYMKVLEISEMLGFKFVYQLLHEHLRDVPIFIVCS